MTDLTQLPHIFNFQSHNVRVADIDNQPWFVATDVFDALEYPKGSRTYQLKQLKPDEVTVLKIQTRKGTRLAKLFSESGLYKLVMRSDKPEAKIFQDWVTRDVLPAIRKDGAYVMGEENLASGEMSEEEFIMKAMQIMQGKVERTTAERDEALSTLDEQAPKVADYEARWARKDTIGLILFAEQSGLKKNKFTAYLREMDYLFNRGTRRNAPYEKYNNNFFVCRDSANGFPQTLITQEGAAHFQGLIDQGVFDHIRSHAA